MHLLDPVADVPAALSVDWLERTLGALPSGVTEASVRHNLALVAGIAQPDRMIVLLHSVLADEGLLATVAERSYRHVNHFDKIVLVDSTDRLGFRLTLHLWTPPYSKQELDDELIHDHRFSFWSNILTGTLVSENFTVGHGDASGDPAGGVGRLLRQYRYSPEKHDDGATGANFYTFRGERRLLAIAPSVERCGDSYFLSYDRTHRVVLPRTSMTCTLVLRGPRQRDFSNVFNSSYPTQDTRITNEMFSVAELRGKLTALVEEICRTRVDAA